MLLQVVKAYEYYINSTLLCWKNAILYDIIFIRNYTGGRRMKKKRRILAFLIAMVMMVTDVSGIWAASENVQDYTLGTESSTEEKGE